ncbi:MAG: PorT family protein [Cyclobacteriaceae bacterium]|nr:PorT family protein [Cyclobacteriaceae bacterium]
MFKTLNSAIFCFVTSVLPALVMGQELETPKETPFAAKSYEKFLWGFRAGINVTTPHFEDPDARSVLNGLPTVGWTVGGVAQFKLSERYAFQTEVGYTRKTSRFTFDADNSENRMDMDFLDISLLLRRRFYFSWGKDIHSDVFIGVGPNINYWFGASGTITTFSGETPYNIVIDGTPDANYNNMYFNGVNSWLYGIDIGVGINAPISARQKVFVEFRATLGQTNLGEPSGTAFINLVGFNGSTFQQNLLKQNLKTFSITASYTFAFNYLESKMGHSTKDKMIKKRKTSKRKRR